jgi:CheY-like chemotaxis protein
MKILMVEDNKAFAEVVCQTLESVSNIAVTHAISKQSALAALRDGFFDLIILDLSIPTNDDALDAAPEHGQIIFHEARKLTPGTPIHILTGSEPDSFSLKLAKYGEQIDLWGSNRPISTIDYHPKEDVDALIGELNILAKDLAVTENIELDTRGKQISFSPEHRRILQTFSRLHGGASCLVQKLGGGLSDAKVYRITVRNMQGHTKIISVAKLGTSDEVQAESEAFKHSVALLSIGTATPLVICQNKGVRDSGGVFYALAEGYDQTFFDFIASKEPSSSKAIATQVQAGLKRWSEAKEMVSTTVGKIRAQLINDENFHELKTKFDLSFTADIEDIEVKVFQSCLHGDLHGGNILVNKEGHPILIDFGDVAIGYTCIDPVTLELSLIFHPDAVKLGLAGSLTAQVDQWPHIDAYGKGSPIHDLVSTCREWAHDVGGSDKAVLAAGYAFAVRQLKYPTVAPELTLRLVKGITDQLRQLKKH